MNDLYVRIPDEQTYNEAVISALVSPWLFSFPNRKIIPPPQYGEIKKNYHGNSKPLLHLFYNDITKCHEMQVTTATIAKSYPHIRNKRLNIIDFDELNYDLCCKVFGNPA